MRPTLPCLTSSLSPFSLANSYLTCSGLISNVASSRKPPELLCGFVCCLSSSPKTMTIVLPPSPQLGASLSLSKCQLRACVLEAGDLEDPLHLSLISLTEETEAQRDRIVYSGSHRKAVPGVTVTCTATAPSTAAVGPQGEGPALFSSPLPINKAIESKLLPRREIDFKKNNPRTL